jgi:dienelactone hydrolase
MTNRWKVGCLVALAVLWALPCSADIDLGFPQQPEHEVIVPPKGPQTGARLYAPAGNGPFPAVVLSHTSGTLQQHMFQWAKRLLGAGYAVLIVDHLGPRHLADNTNFDLSVTDYAKDDVAAMRHLRTLPFIDGQRIAQMGLSYGAMAGLREASRNFRDKNLGGEKFAAIVSVYPWCNQQGGKGYKDHQWNFFDDTDIPLLVVVGADDDDADPRSCIDKAKENAARGLPVELSVLPNTTHAFDHTWMKNPVVTNLGGRSITNRYNPEAVETTWKLTLDFLGRRVASAAPH